MANKIYLSYKEKRNYFIPQSYTPEFKKKIVRLHLEEKRTYKSITVEYGVSKASIFKRCAEFSEECQVKAVLNPNTLDEAELLKENLRLRKELEETKKENLFLKNRRHFLQRKSIRGLSVSRTIPYFFRLMLAAQAVTYLPECLL